MYDLVFRPSRFFERQSSGQPDLFFPALIVISIAGIGFGIALEVSRNLSISDGFDGLRWRLSVLMSGIAALTNLLLWPLACGVLMASGQVLWNRSVNYRQLLAAVGYAQLPTLFGGVLSLALVIQKPIIVSYDVAAKDVQKYLYTETVLGTTRYVSIVSGLWTVILLVLAVKSNLRLDVIRAAVTVLVPYAVYRCAVLLFELAR